MLHGGNNLDLFHRESVNRNKEWKKWQRKKERNRDMNRLR